MIYNKAFSKMKIKNGPDFLETFQVIPQLHVKCVRGNLGVLAILVIFLSVKKPVWNFELARISNDGHQIVDLSIGEFTSSARKE